MAGYWGYGGYHQNMSDLPGTPTYTGGAPAPSAPPAYAPPTAPVVGGFPTQTLAGGGAGLDLAAQMALALANIDLQRQLGMAGVTGFYEEYQTIHGPRTVSQMREELTLASGGMDKFASMSDTEIVAEYGRVTGQNVQAVRKPTLAYQQFLGSKSGPIDYQMYKALNAKPGFGQMTMTPSWEAFAAQELGNDAWAPPTETTQPIKMTPGTWNNLGQSGQEMYASNLRALGIDQRDALQYMANAFPQGRGSEWSRWAP